MTAQGQPLLSLRLRSADNPTIQFCIPDSRIMVPFMRTLQAFCEAVDPKSKPDVRKSIDVFFAVSSTSTRSLSQTAWPSWLPQLLALLHSRLAAVAASDSQTRTTECRTDQRILACIKRLAAVTGSPETAPKPIHPLTDLPETVSRIDDAAAIAALPPHMAAVLWILVRSASAPPSHQRIPIHVSAPAIYPSADPDLHLSLGSAFNSSLFDVSDTIPTSISMSGSAFSQPAKNNQLIQQPQPHFCLPASPALFSINDIPVFADGDLDHDSHKDGSTTSQPDSAYDAVSEIKASVSAAISNASSVAKIASGLTHPSADLSATNSPITHSWEDLGSRAQIWNRSNSADEASSINRSSFFLTEASFDVFDAFCRSQTVLPSFISAPQDITVTERFVVACMLRASIGIPSTIFHVANDTKTVCLRYETSPLTIARVRIASLSTSALEGILQSVAQLGTFYLRIHHLSDSLHKFPAKHGLTGEALACSLDIVLSQSHNLASKLEDALDQGHLHVLAVMPCLEKHYAVLQGICNVFGINESGQSHIRSGCEILSLLYNAISLIDLLETHPLRDTFMTLFCDASRPMLAWMDFWLGLNSQNDHNSTKSLSNPESVVFVSLNAYDPFGEFFIAPISESVNASHTSQFMLCTSSRRAKPSFINDALAADILEAGTTYRLLRSCATRSNAHPMLMYPYQHNTPRLQSRVCRYASDAADTQASSNRYYHSQLKLWARVIRDRVSAYQDHQHQLQLAISRRIDAMRTRDRESESQRTQLALALQAKRDQLRASIDTFLADRATAALSSRRDDQVRQAEELQRDIAAAAERDRLTAVEVEDMVKEFQRRMKSLESAQERIVWRRKRLELSDLRREVLNRSWEPLSSESVNFEAHAESVDEPEATPQHVIVPSIATSTDLDASDDKEAIQTKEEHEKTTAVCEPDAIEPVNLTIQPSIVSDTPIATKNEDNAANMDTKPPHEPFVDHIESGEAVDSAAQEHDRAETCPSDENHVDVSVQAGIDNNQDPSMHVAEEPDPIVKETHPSSFSTNEINLSETTSSACASTSSSKSSHELSQFVGPFGSAEQLPGFFGMKNASPNPIKDTNIANNTHNHFDTSSIHALISQSPITTWKTQIRLISRAILMTLFSDEPFTTTHAATTKYDYGPNDIRFHIGILESFLCLRDGSVVVGLKSSLFVGDESQNMFDTQFNMPDRVDCESGLDLNGVGSWPPDLNRLAVMLDPVLAASMKRVSETMSVVVDPDVQLPTSRTSQGALSFLRFVYSPKLPFSEIVTPSVVHGLEDVFQWLLRLIQVDEALCRVIGSTGWRRLSATKSAANDSLSLLPAERSHMILLMHSMRAFVHALVVFSFETVVGASWRSFFDALDIVAKRVYHGQLPTPDECHDDDASIDSEFTDPDNFSERSSDANALARSIHNLGSLRESLARTINSIRDRLFLRRPKQHSSSPTKSESTPKATPHVTIATPATNATSTTIQSATTPRQYNHYRRQQEEYIGHVLETVLEIVLKLSRRVQGLDDVTESVLALNAAFQVRVGVLVDALKEEVAVGSMHTNYAGDSRKLEAYPLHVRASDLLGALNLFTKSSQYVVPATQTQI